MPPPFFAFANSKNKPLNFDEMYRNIYLQIGVLLCFAPLNFNLDSFQKFDRTKSGSEIWKLIWSDEFNYSGLPDSTKWNYEVGGHGWGNNEKQFYLGKSLENSFVKDGLLHIVALKKDFKNSKYTSSKLTTYKKISVQYGKIEVMAKLPKGKGTWPAIWMLPESLQEKSENWPLCGEIDIMEHVGKNPGSIHTSLHSELYNHIKGTQITHFDKFQDVFETFHRYAIEWNSESIKFLIDDKLFFESFKGQEGRISTNEGWPFDKPYFLILNLAIGGNWGGEIDDSMFPVEMQVDYVRIYHR
jgi:beta-glucanase (GH16 family)